MAKSSARTVEEYLKELPEDRRAVVAAVRKMILRIVGASGWGGPSREANSRWSPLAGR